MQWMASVHEVRTDTPLPSETAECYGNREQYLLPLLSTSLLDPSRPELRHVVELAIAFACSCENVKTQSDWFWERGPNARET